MLHIYNRHYRKERIFRDRKDVERFRKLLFDCSVKCGIDLKGYAIMDNHFHVLVGERDCGKFMMSVQRGYAQYYNYKLKRRGQVFERRYKKKVVDTVEYLRNMKKYLLINPIDRVLEMEVRGMVSSFAIDSYIEAYCSK